MSDISREFFSRLPFCRLRLQAPLLPNPMFSLAAAVAALAPPSARADVQRAWRAPVPPVMLWRAAQRHITFSSITDDAEAISKLRQIAEEISTWSGEDWAMFNAPAVKLRLDTQGSDRYGGAGPSVVH